MATRCFSLCTVIIRLTCDEPRVEDELATMLVRNGAVPADDDPADVDLLIRSEPEGSPAPEGRTADLLHIDEPAPGVHLWHSASGFRIDHTGGYLEVKPQGRQCVGVFSVAQVAEYDIRVMGMLAITLLMRSQGLFPVHAAALSKGDSAVLLIAPSGNGKSTLAYSLVREGWDYLSDDTLLLRAGFEQVDAYPLRREFSLDTRLSERFPELSLHAWPRQHLKPHKWSVDVSRLYPDQAAKSCTPAIMLFPQIEAVERSETREIPANDALRILVEQSAFGISLHAADAPRHLDVLGRLVRQAKSYQIRAGRDLFGNSGLASQTVEQLFSKAHIDV